MYYKTKDERYLQNKTQMVIRTNKKKNKTDGFLMTLVPDVDYMKTNNFDAYSSSYRKWQKEYNGIVLYHTLNGDFANGWYIADGKVTKTISMANTTATIDVRLNSNHRPSYSIENGDCIDYTWTEWVRTCTDWYVNGIYQRTSCGEWYPEDTWNYIVCPSNAGYTGWGGGDYNPAPLDCFGVPGGSAYMDQCAECVGGNTGLEPCNECQEIQSEITVQLNSTSTLLAVRSNESQTGGCGTTAGQIYRNGQIVNWSSITIGTVDNPGVRDIITKTQYTDSQAKAYLLNSIQNANNVSSYGFDSKITGLIGVVAAALKKTLPTVVACAKGMVDIGLSNMANLYQNVYNKYTTDSNLQNGMYVISTISSTTLGDFVNTSCTEEFYYANGCPITKITY